ncbi:MAG: ATP-binding protein, partial [Candidatus Hodarchaeales archaeon]
KVAENQNENNDIWKQASQQMEAVISVTKAFIKLDFFQMLEEVLSTITNMIRGKYGAILLVHGSDVELVVHTGNPPESLVKTVLRQSVETANISQNESLNAVGLAAQTFFQQKTIVLNDLNNLSVSDAALDVVKNVGITDLLSTPIIYHGQVLGVIQLARTNDQHFTSQEVEVVESFGRELGLVITEKAAREIAEEAKQDLEFFIDLLTHDISSQAMIAYSSLEEIKDAIDQNDEDSQFFVQSALQSLQRVQNIIDQVRLLSMIQELGAAEFTPTDICGAVERSARVIKTMFPEEEIEITIHQTKSPIFVQGTTILDNCIINLLQNAVLADRNPIKKITIDINSGNENNRCRIAITDRGEGIPEEMQEKIFQRFFRIRSRSKGSGLGLFITKSILEKLNGRITVQDRVEGDYSQGSCFIITLPEVDIENFPS